MVKFPRYKRPLNLKIKYHIEYDQYIPKDVLLRFITFGVFIPVTLLIYKPFDPFCSANTSYYIGYNKDSGFISLDRFIEETRGTNNELLFGR